MKNKKKDEFEIYPLIDEIHFFLKEDGRKYMEDEMRLLLYNIILIELECYKGYKELEKIYSLFLKKSKSITLIREVKTLKRKIYSIEQFFESISDIDKKFILNILYNEKKNLNINENLSYKFKYKIIWNFVKEMEIKKVRNVLKRYFDI